MLGDGTVLAPDGAQAFHGSAQAAGKPSLRGVNHNQKMFTPVGRLLKSTLDKATAKMLRAQTKGKTPSVKETSRYFMMAAGDNSVEGTQGHIKNTRRRLGNSGRYNSEVAEDKSVHGARVCCPVPSCRLRLGAGCFEAVPRSLVVCRCSSEAS